MKLQRACATVLLIQNAPTDIPFGLAVDALLEASLAMDPSTMRVFLVGGKLVEVRARLEMFAELGPEGGPHFPRRSIV